MKKKLIFIAILLIILAGNLYVFNDLKKDYFTNTHASLDGHNLDDWDYETTEDDIKSINNNYNFYQLKLQNNNSKYDRSLKELWTIDLIILGAIFIYLNNRKSL